MSKYKYIIIVMGIILSFISLKGTVYYPYFQKVENGQIQGEYISEPNEYNIVDCLYFGYYLFAEDPIYVRTDYAIDNVIDIASHENINFNQFDLQDAEEGAMNAWNCFVDENNKPFTVDNSDDSNYYSAGSVVNIVPRAGNEWGEIEWPEEWGNSASGKVEYAIYVDEQNGYETIDYNSVDYPPGAAQTIVWLNMDPEYTSEWVWLDDGQTPESGQTDVQHIVTHELGHVLGFDDDTNPNDNIETVMSQGTYYSRNIENPLRESLSVLYEVNINTTGIEDYLVFKNSPEYVSQNSTCQVEGQGYDVEPYDGGMTGVLKLFARSAEGNILLNSSDCQDLDYHWIFNLNIPDL